MPAPDPAASRILLIGTATYHEDAYQGRQLPAVARNLTALAKEFSAAWKMPDAHVTLLLDPADPGKISKAVQGASVEATDTLVCYYAGHGFLSRRGNLYLTASSSTEYSAGTAFDYGVLREEMLESRAPRKIVILDCCFSGHAHPAMGDEAELTPIKGAYVLTSTGRHEVSMAPVEGTYTAFTGELIEVLTHGIGELADQPLLSLDQVYKEVRGRLRSSAGVLPHRRDHGTLGDDPLWPNRTYIPAEPPGPVPPDAAPAESGPASTELEVPLAGTQLWDPVTFAFAAVLGLLAGVALTVVRSGTVGGITGVLSFMFSYAVVVFVQSREAR